MAVLNFVTENWYWIVGILLLPNAIWWIVVFTVGGTTSGYQTDTEMLRYSGFFRYGVRMENTLADTNPFRKVMVIINLLSFFWLWGYVLTLVFVALGFICRWVWKGIKAIGNALSDMWEAL